MNFLRRFLRWLDRELRKGDPEHWLYDDYAEHPLGGPWE